MSIPKLERVRVRAVTPDGIALVAPHMGLGQKIATVLLACVLQTGAVIATVGALTQGHGWGVMVLIDAISLAVGAWFLLQALRNTRVVIDRYGLVYLKRPISFARARFVPWEAITGVTLDDRTETPAFDDSQGGFPRIYIRLELCSGAAYRLGRFWARDSASELTDVLERCLDDGNRDSVLGGLSERVTDPSAGERFR